MPLWVGVLLAVLFGIRPRRNELVGLALGIGGLLLLLNPASTDWGVPGELLGALGLLANAVLWAGTTIHVRRHHWTQSPLELQPGRRSQARCRPSSRWPSNAAGDPGRRFEARLRTAAARDRVCYLGGLGDHAPLAPGVRDRVLAIPWTVRLASGEALGSDIAGFALVRGRR
jgi:hypothetical protein